MSMVATTESIAAAPAGPPAWNRRADEGIKPFAAFREYLALGFDRSLAEVGRKLGKSKTLMDRWSSAYKWVERAAAWEIEQARLRDLALVDARAADAQKWVDRERELKEAEHRVGRLLIAKAEKMLEYPLARTVIEKDGKTTIIEPTNWSQHSAARLVDVGSEVSRRSMGLPTEIKTLSGPDGGPIPVIVAAKVVYLPTIEDKPQ